MAAPALLLAATAGSHHPPQLLSGAWKSLWVNRSGGVQLFSGANGTGSVICLPAGRKASTLVGRHASPGSVRLLPGA